MKVQIDIDEELLENIVIIRCNKLDEKIQKMQAMLMDLIKESKYLVLYNENTECYVSLDNILFFETADNCICAHTVDNIYQTRYRLYELEEILPGCFMRVSKSTILNLNHIYAITRNITASSLVQFMNSHKQVYVSRYYYKPLKCRLEEKRKSL